MDLNTVCLVGSFVRVPRNLIFREEEPRIVEGAALPGSVLSEISTKDVTIKHLLKTTDEHAYMVERYYGDTWVLWSVEAPTDPTLYDKPYTRHTRARYEAKTLGDWERYGVPDLLSFWQEDVGTEPDLNAYEGLELDMKPPDAIPVPTAMPAASGDCADPKLYLSKKYYEALFQLRIPLAFFVKSKLARAKNLCSNASACSYEQAVAALVQDFQEFDRRHSLENFGLLRYALPQFAQELRTKCVKDEFKLNMDHLDDTGSEYAAELAQILKIRELRLQLIMHIELIALRNMDSRFRDFETRYENTLTKRSFNAFRASSIYSRKSNKEKKKKTFKPLALDVCEQLDLLLDKVAIIDILLSTDSSVSKTGASSHYSETYELLAEYKRNLSREGKEESSLGFIRYVLVPYWSRKIPNVTAFITKKIKGLNMQKFTAAPSQTSSIQESSTTTSRRSSLSSNVPISSTPSSPLIPTTSAGHSVTAPKLMKAKANSNLLEFLESDSTLNKYPSTLSKSNSDLTLNRLQKRQLAVTDLTTSAARHGSYEGIGNISKGIAKPNRSFTSSKQSFKRATKRKLDQITESKAGANTSVVQITATPARTLAKPVNNKMAIVKSPFSEVKPAANLVEIAATPLRNEPECPSGSVLEHTGIVKTPASRDHDPLGISNKPKAKKVRRRLFAP
ncbi:AaceriAFL019Cp [[Ashbya] aceris (nom. inval.)]|nr:AaceriAFL019Cp [[Ashbya] aceris (nom. inval.)]